MKTSPDVLGRLARVSPPLSCLLAAVLLVCAAPAHAGSCGGDGQGPCGGGGDWYIKGTCPFCVPWYHANPDFCITPNTLGKDGKCHKPSVPPPAPCRADCQAKKINAALGNPTEPSNNNSTRVSRKDAGIADSEFVHIDIGGEGSYGFQTRCDGYEDSVNLNPDSVIHGGSQTGQPIPNRVPGYAQNLPFTNGFADKLSVDVETFNAEWAEEMARVIKPHGALTVCGVPGVDNFEAGLRQLLNHGLHITATNNAGSGRKELVLAVPPDYTYTAVTVPDTGTCGAGQGKGSKEPRQNEPCEIDIMFVYTESARKAVADRGGDIAALVQDRIHSMNEVFANSGLAARVRLIYVGPTTYDETTSGNNARTILSQLLATDPNVSRDNGRAVRQIRTLREALGADLVSMLATGLVIDSGGGAASTCGIGSTKLLRSEGFSVVRPYCINELATPYSVAHEVGHNFGLQHSRFTVGKGANHDPNGYNYGYVDTQNRFYTVMAYPDACVASKVNCVLAPYWSSPNLRYEGNPVGTAREDNVRALQRNAPIVEAYFPARDTPLINPSDPNFDNVLVNTESPAQQLTVYNLSDAPITVADVTLSGSKVFTLKQAGATACQAGRVIPAHQSCDISVGFLPTIEAALSTTLIVSFQGGAPTNLTTTIRGSGFASKPKLEVKVSSDFGNVEVSSRASSTLRIINTGTKALTIRQVTASGAEFSVSDHGIDPDSVCKDFPGAFKVDPEASCTLTLSFRPTGTGQKAGRLTIQSDDPAQNTWNMDLTGYGTRNEL